MWWNVGSVSRIVPSFFGAVQLSNCYMFCFFYAYPWYSGFFLMQLLLVYSAKKNNSACQKPPQRYEAWFFIQRITGVVASITPNVAIPKKSLVLSGFCGFDLPWPAPMAPMALRWFRGIHDLDLLLSIAALIQAPTISGLHGSRYRTMN